MEEGGQKLNERRSREEEINKGREGEIKIETK